jgi:cytochrome c oxidase subunit II
LPPPTEHKPGLVSGATGIRAVGATGGREPLGETVRKRVAGLRATTVCLGALLLAGCGRTQNSLAPESHQARDIASLFWWMMGGAWIGLGVVVALLFLAWHRRRRRGWGTDTEGAKPGERLGWIVVIGAGIVLPIVVLSTVFIIGDLFVIRTTQAPASSSTSLTVRVIGHQWWWEARYPSAGAVTANEIHIPVRRRVRIVVQSDDVIHSFWAPQLNRKIDAIPGRTNMIVLDADVPGHYRGQCAEFCGVQHAHMGLVVVAQPEAAFRRWLANQARPAQTSLAGAAARGKQVFDEEACSSCHAIRGTDAHGYVGPDLTHLASRNTLGAVTVLNRPETLAAWIRDSQHFKPGNQMPPFPHLGPQRLQDLTAYLEGLK